MVTGRLGLLACLLLSGLAAAQPFGADDLLMSALDSNRDSVISRAEIAMASAVLVSLDSNRDGQLDTTEIGGALNARGRGGGRFGLGLAEGAAPVRSALDTDSNGRLSAREIAMAGERLLALDSDNSATLEGGELVAVQGAGLGRGGGFGGRGGFGVGGGSSTRRPEPEELDPADGVARIDSHASFERLSYQGQDVLIDTHLANLEYVKFVLVGARTNAPKLYFMDTNLYRAHMMFMSAVGLGRGNPASNSGETMLGVLVYRPFQASASGEAGLYTFEFEPNNVFDFELIKAAHDQLVAGAPIMDGRLAYHPLPAAMSLYQAQQDAYEAAGLDVYLDEEAGANIAFQPLNAAEGVGMLRLMRLDERPGSRDIVLYENLPNELPHVAGIITAVQQTPLSHVNLRAIQDDVPNAYIRNAAVLDRIASLIGKYVRYRVSGTGYEIREASLDEVEAHFAGRRPAEPQVPVRNLAVTTIRPLHEVGFADSDSVGVKAANVATLGSLGFPDEMVPQGFAIPFYFYEEFMRFNGFHDAAASMQMAPGFGTDLAERERALGDLRARIEAGGMPDWMLAALASMQRSFPDDVGIRLRSSTNNEDLPGFSGAGLYDSVTHRPDEGHIASSVRQVYASLWNLRAFEEREFFRIDHAAAAMGILVHPNYSDELANGVAVSDDILYQAPADRPGRTYYINAQLGEDLVTNPEADSIPEELLLSSYTAADDELVRRSNRADGRAILEADQLQELRLGMNRIHQAFRELYGIGAGEPFAMEIEFKITAAGNLAFKQARPWVY